MAIAKAYGFIGTPHAHIAFRHRDGEICMLVQRPSGDERDRLEAGLESKGTERL